MARSINAVMPLGIELCVEWFFYKLSAIKHARCWWAWKYVLNVASLLRIEQVGYSGIVFIEELSDSVHHKQVLSFRSFSQFRGSCTSCHSIWLLQALPMDWRGWGLAGKLSALSFSLFLFLSFPISHLYWALLWKPHSVGPRWRPLAGQIAISTLSVWFGGRLTCLSHGSLRDEISLTCSHRAQILWSACPYAAESHALQQFCISAAWWGWWWWPKGA